MLVRGNNNTDVWGHDADRMAVALTNEVPFKIEIVQPKAPLVRNGQMDLKIVATRAIYGDRFAGFAGKHVRFGPDVLPPKPKWGEKHP